MPARPLYPEIFLVSFAAILLEVSYTRVFSFKLVYYFTYLIIGLAMLGLGSSSVLVALAPRLRRAAGSRLIPACCLVVGASVLGGYLLVAWTQLNAFHLIESLVPLTPSVVVREGAKLALVCLCVFTPFFTAGLAIAGIFATQPAAFSRLYFADLLGAGMACAVVIPAISFLSPPGCVLLAGLVATLAGLRLAVVHARPLLVPMAVVGALLAVGVALPARLPDPIPDRVKGLGPKAGPLPPTLFSRWSPVFRVDVLPSPLSDARRSIFHDGMMGSVLNRFDGNVASLSHFDRDDRAYPFRMLRPEPRVAIIGAAGGNEILASLWFGAAHVTAVELNPVTVSLLTTHFADYSGRLAENPRVTLVNGEGRSFLRSSGVTYDLVWFVAPDSYAAMNAATSGAYVLSESYLYTREMLLDSLAHLADDGIVCAQFGEVDFEKKPNRTTRYLATTRDALRLLGVRDFGRHVLVATTPGVFTTSTILVRKTPFSDAETERFVGALAAAKSTARWVTGRPELLESPIGKVVALPDGELERWYDASFYDVRPVTDDAPFFWHFVGFRSALGRLRQTEVAARMEEGSGERLLMLFLVVAIAFAAVALLLPLMWRRELWRAVPGKLRAGVFFGAIGTGFMFIEIALIQRLTLFLGYPTYSLTVTLFALLIATGVGSLLSERYTDRNRALAVLACVLIALVLFYRFGLGPLTAAAGGFPFAARVAITVAVLAPLGLCLGGFMPVGLRTVTAASPHHEEFIAWSWAVNGFFSVVSSVLATVLAMAYGFDAVMVVAVGIYLVGIAALVGLPAPRAAR